MHEQDSAQSVVRINLNRKTRSVDPRATVVDPPAPPISPPSSGMSMDQLKNNYDAIIHAHAIFYPVVYQFRRELGRGRQGVVFLGVRQGARGCTTEHSIKVFDPSIYRSTEEYWTDMGRIASQISRLQRIQSPNLVPMYSYEETSGIGYVQMEAIDGMDLKRFFDRDHIEIAKRNSTKTEWEKFTKTIFVIEGDRMRFRPGMVVYILRRMVRGVERLHSANFLHCDVKPANIMIDRLGTVRIIDFGRAVITGERVSFLFGSPMYMSPETHRREPSTFQSDFYSIGLIGLEMLRGRPLTDSENVEEEELLRIKMELPDRLYDLLPSQVRRRRSLTRIIRRLVEPDPANRYGSAKEADVGDDGLIVVDQQLAREGMADHGRILSEYMTKLVDDKTRRVEVDPETENRVVTSQVVR